MKTLKHLFLSPLDSQLVEHGDRGFNCDTNIVRSSTVDDMTLIIKVNGTEGKPYLVQTRNESHVGHAPLDHEEYDLHVIYDPPQSMYAACIVEECREDEKNYKRVILYRNLGHRIDDAKITVLDFVKSYNMRWYDHSDECEKSQSIAA